MHETTTDLVRLADRDVLPPTHSALVDDLQRWLQQAGTLVRAERAEALASRGGDSLLKRSRDWSEVRPEWGLAANAAFVVAPRWRTSGQDLGGRVFLHSYDFAADPQLKTLELILTAPVIVTNWINLQYYASTVNHSFFGSGNKTIQNVVGAMGVVLGNAGDLRIGLPWQSVHDGSDWRHEPLRLAVVIDAPRSAIDAILNRHKNVADLAANGWFQLISIDDDHFFRYGKNRRWTGEWLPAPPTNEQPGIDPGGSNRPLPDETLPAAGTLAPETRCSSVTVPDSANSQIPHEPVHFIFTTDHVLEIRYFDAPTSCRRWSLPLVYAEDLARWWQKEGSTQLPRGGASPPLRAGRIFVSTLSATQIYCRGTDSSGRPNLTGYQFPRPVVETLARRLTAHAPSS